MKVSINWLKELVDLRVSLEELIRLLPLRTIATKEITPDFIELDMKGYNRADLLSLRGVAYEVAAITDSKVKFADQNENEYIWVGQNLPNLQVDIQNKDLCPLYAVAKIEGLKVERSPKSWVEKLESSGVRSINNIADITNLVMIEYGQPLHAFDSRSVKDEKIIVRTAKLGEKIVTLDGKSRDLIDTDLLITNPQNILGIAGMMGGKDSEVNNQTSTIFLEAAIFEPTTLRKTAIRLGLQSEASKRFQHGLTKKRLLESLDTAIRMYQELGGKLTALTIEGNYPQDTKTIKLTQKKTNSLIGIDISSELIEEYLKKLYYRVIKTGGGVWEITPPYFRLDTIIEEDLIEEIARMYGYEKIPPSKLTGELPEKIDQSLFDSIHSLKQNLVDAGFTEVQTYPYYSTKVLENLGWYDDDNLKDLLKVANPISSETEYLRQNLWPNLIEVVSKNLSRRDIAIFEIGKIYYQNQQNKPDEKYSLSLALLNSTNNPIQELYSLFQKINQALDLKLSLDEETKPYANLQFFHPNRFIQLKYGNETIGGIAEVHKKISDKFNIPERVAVLEIGISKFYG